LQFIKHKKALLIRQSSIGDPSEQLTTIELRDIRRTVTTCALEAEKSSLLAVARERLLKSQQVAKRSSGCCGDLRIVEISGGAVITCISEWCI
jgi:hypothetical protein